MVAEEVVGVGVVILLQLDVAQHTHYRLTHVTCPNLQCALIRYAESMALLLVDLAAVADHRKVEMKQKPPHPTDHHYHSPWLIVLLFFCIEVC